MSNVKFKIKTGDQVVVLAGKDKGAKGEVTRVLKDDGRVVVQGVNIASKHRKPTQLNPQGGIDKIEMPIHVSNVALVDPKSDKPTRVGYEIDKDGNKTRIARRSGQKV